MTRLRRASGVGTLLWMESRDKMIARFERECYPLSDSLKMLLFNADWEACYGKLLDMRTRYLHGSVYRF